MLRNERNPVNDGIKFKITKNIPNGLWFPYIPTQLRHPGRKRPVVAAPAIQHVQVDPALYRHPGARRADHTAAADEENPESAHQPTIVAIDETQATAPLR
jgi:hypothetical protein